VTSVVEDDQAQVVCPLAAIGQFADLTCCTRVHRHDYFTLVWLGHGRADLFVDFAYHELSPGSLVCIAPGQVHAWDNKGEKSEIGIAFSEEFFLLQGQKFPTFLLDVTSKANEPLIVDVESEKRSLFNALFSAAQHSCNEEENPRKYEQTLLTYLNVALLELSRLAPPMLLGETAAAGHNAPSRLARAFEAAVETHYLNRMKVHEFAALLGVSTNHLVQTVREQTDKTPGRILDQRLVLEAKRLLVHTTESLAEIAFALAFPSPSQFGRWFKKHASMSPGEFRRRFAVFS